MPSLRTLAACLGVCRGVCLAARGTAPGGTRPKGALPSPVDRWLAQEPSSVAHRGGSADRPEGTAQAYEAAASWSPDLALEAPVRSTADGVWVVCHDRTTGSVFDADLDVPTSTWTELSRLRTRAGDLPMARLDDVLAAHPDRVWLVDDKPDTDADGLLDLLDASGGPDRFVVKGFSSARELPRLAAERGYLTWGYWYADMTDFHTAQRRWDLLALAWDAPAGDWRAALATGKPVFGHVVATADQARTALDRGATGLMVAGVTAVVPR